ncbi:MAG: antibiotic biosynthesis monooxygenase protein, partial [Frankiales bacterium]|nr:antibiotic biosynthesis monooxygenase protein [Frankiales bacterium]
MPDIVAIATLTPLPGKTDELIAAMTTLIEQVHAREEGCLLYALHRHPDGERLVMVEKYTGPDAVKAHRESEHFRAAGAAFAGLLAGRPEVLGLEPVPLGDAVK